MRKRVHSDKPTTAAEHKIDTAKEIAARNLIKAPEKSVE